MQNICGQNTNLLWSLGEKEELEVREAPHTQFTLTRCLRKLTYLCHGHPRRGPVLSHSPLEGSGGAMMNSKTMCDGKRTIATLCDGGENGSSVFTMNVSDTETMMYGNEE